MTLHRRIREARERSGATRSEIADLADISTGYVKEIEEGSKEPSLRVLGKLAQALGVTSAYLLAEEDEQDTMVGLSRREFLQPSLLGGTALLNASGLHETDSIQPGSSPASTELLVTRGDIADIQGAWNDALRLYIQAISLLPDDYRKARYQVDKVAQMHINLGQHDQAEHIFADVENTIEAWGDPGTVNYDLITGLLAAKRGWLHHFSGQLALAISDFTTALTIARRWHNLSIESNSHHFLGSVVSHQHSYLLFPELFSSQSPASEVLHYGLTEVVQAQDMDRASEPNVAFGLRSAALMTFMLNDVDDAKRLLHRSADMLNTWLPAQAETLVWWHRMDVILNGATYSRQDFADMIEATEELCWTLASQPHPFAYVGATISLLTIQYLYGDFKKSSIERQTCLDLCAIAMLLHSYPEHFYFIAARELLMRFTHDMSRKAYTSYADELIARIAHYQDSFSTLRKFASPKLASLNRVVTTLTAVGKVNHLL